MILLFKISTNFKGGSKFSVVGIETMLKSKGVEISSDCNILFSVEEEEKASFSRTLWFSIKNLITCERE
jgi:hypothetical protein